MRIHASSLRDPDDGYIHLGYLAAHTTVYESAAGLVAPGLVVAIMGVALFARRSDGWVFDFLGARALGVMLVVVGMALVYAGVNWRRIDPAATTRNRIAYQLISIRAERPALGEGGVTGDGPSDDGWGRPLRQRVERSGDRLVVTISSAGPDGVAGSADDLVQREELAVR